MLADATRWLHQLKRKQQTNITPKATMSSRTDYAPLPSNDDDGPVVRTPSYRDDPRFREEPVPAWKRAGLILVIIALLYFGYKLQMYSRHGAVEPQIVHADR